MPPTSAHRLFSELSLLMCALACLPACSLACLSVSRGMDRRRSSWLHATMLVRPRMDIGIAFCTKSVSILGLESCSSSTNTSMAGDRSPCMGRGRLGAPSRRNAWQRSLPRLMEQLNAKDRTANGGCSPWACAVANAHQGAVCVQPPGDCACRLPLARCNARTGRGDAVLRGSVSFLRAPFLGLVTRETNMKDPVLRGFLHFETCPCMLFFCWSFCLAVARQEPSPQLPGNFSTLTLARRNCSGSSPTIRTGVWMKYKAPPLADSSPFSRCFRLPKRLQPFHRIDSDCATKTKKERQVHASAARFLSPLGACISGSRIWLEPAAAWLRAPFRRRACGSWRICSPRCRKRRGPSPVPPTAATSVPWKKWVVSTFVLDGVGC